jgi:hypothetical protein
VEQELLPDQGAAQIPLQSQTLMGLDVHLLRVELVVVAAPLLGAIHGGVGVLEQPVAFRRRPDRYADATCHEDLMPIQDEWLREEFQDILRHGDGIVRVGQVFEHDRELVASQARHGVALPHAPLYTPRYLFEQLVPIGVPQGIVHGLEAVQVQEHERHQVAVAFGPRQRLFEAVPEQGTVGEACERVVLCHVG